MPDHTPLGCLVLSCDLTCDGERTDRGCVRRPPPARVGRTTLTKDRTQWVDILYSPSTSSWKGILGLNDLGISSPNSKGSFPGHPQFKGITTGHGIYDDLGVIPVDGPSEKSIIVVPDCLFYDVHTRQSKDKMSVLSNSKSSVP